jgi:hypothetical protein
VIGGQAVLREGLDRQGIRYGWVVECPDCPWKRAQEDSPEEPGARLVLLNLLDAHRDQEHPED